MAKGLSIRTTVVGAIAGVALLSQLVFGVWQYFDSARGQREEIRHINEAVLQPVAELSARGIDGGNQMILSDASATALYKASKVRYLKVSGTSAGAEKTVFTEAIPPQRVEQEYVAEGADAARLRQVAQAAKETGFDEDAYLFVVKAKLAGVKNGGEITAVFPADALKTLHWRTIKQVAPLSLLVVALSLGLALLIGGRIARPIVRLASQVEGISASLDLTRVVRLDVADVALNREAAETSEAFNRLLENLGETLRRVLENISQVSSAVAELSGAARGVAERTEQQSGAASAMAAAMEEMTANLGEIAGNARHVDASSHQSGDLCGEGGEIIHRAAEEMRGISDTVRGGSQSIGELSRQSRQISAIVEVIRDIADQTNLLALNAAIEAARAGETGRGFAVVADEVRKLAERTAQSTRSITEMIDAIQGTANTAVSGMEDAVRRVQSGVDLANQAGESINRINDGATQVIRGVEEITLALQQQNQASMEVSRHVEAIAHMTEENSHSASETAQLGMHLEMLASAMQEAVRRFRV
jgi:methyl-accepting chemotaxis protein